MPVLTTDLSNTNPYYIYSYNNDCFTCSNAKEVNDAYIYYGNMRSLYGYVTNLTDGLGNASGSCLIFAGQNSRDHAVGELMWNGNTQTGTSTFKLILYKTDLQEVLSQNKTATLYSVEWTFPIGWWKIFGGIGKYAGDDVLPDLPLGYVTPTTDKSTTSSNYGRKLVDLSPVVDTGSQLYEIIRIDKVTQKQVGKESNRRLFVSSHEGWYYVGSPYCNDFTGQDYKYYIRITSVEGTACTRWKRLNYGAIYEPFTPTLAYTNNYHTQALCNLPDYDHSKTVHTYMENKVAGHDPNLKYISTLRPSTVETTLVLTDTSGSAVTHNLYICETDEQTNGLVIRKVYGTNSSFVFGDAPALSSLLTLSVTTPTELGTTYSNTLLCTYQFTRDAALPYSPFEIYIVPVNNSNKPIVQNLAYYTHTLLDTTSNTVSLFGLQPGVTYKIAIIATKQNSILATASCATNPIITPNAPILTATSTGTTITLTDANGAYPMIGAPVDIVTYDNTTHTTYNTQRTVTDGTYVLSNLIPAHTYTIQLTYKAMLTWGYNAVTSNSLDVTTESPIRLDTPLPQCITTMHTVDITWSRIKNAQCYKVIIGDKKIITYQETCVIDALQPNTSYTAMVYAIGDGICYMDSQAEPLVCVTKPFVQLETPTLTLEAVVGHVSRIKPTWAAVPNAVSYRLRYAQSLDAASTGSIWTSGTAITGLATNTTYNVQVQAVGNDIDHGSSEWSSTVAFTTAALPALTKPTITLQAIAVKALQVTILNVPASQQCLMRYGTTTPLGGNGVTWTSDDVLTGLDVAAQYYVQVKLIGDNVDFSDSEWSDAMRGTTLGPQPLTPPTPALTHPELDATKLLPTWNRVENAASYMLRYSTNNPPTGDGTTWVSGAAITSLSPATDYYVQVKAVSNLSEYSDSDWSSVITHITNTLIVLSTPTNITSEYLSGTSLLVTWNIVTHASNYRLRIGTSPALTDEGTIVNSTENDTNHGATITNLVENTTYYIQVRSIGDQLIYGDSEWSTSLSITTLDTTFPTIVLNGEASISLAYNSIWIDPGVVASDNIDTSLTVTTKYTLGGVVYPIINTTLVGTWEIKYSVIDSSHNTSTITRTVIVAAPVVDDFEATQVSSGVLCGFTVPSGIDGKTLIAWESSIDDPTSPTATWHIVDLTDLTGKNTI